MVPEHWQMQEQYAAKAQSGIKGIMFWLSKLSESCASHFTVTPLFKVASLFFFFIVFESNKISQSVSGSSSHKNHFIPFMEINIK